MATATNIKLYRWDLETDHCEISFSVRSMVITVVQGTFQEFSGFMLADENGILQSLEVEIDAASLTTHNYDRDMHLLSSAFFDVKSFPVITFKSTDVSPSAEEGFYTVSGNLTLRNASYPLKFEAEFGGKIQDIGGEDRAGYSIDMNINRFDLGLLWDEKMGDGSPVIAADVNIHVEAELVKAGE